MGLTMKERKAVTAVMVARYRRASKKQKGQLLDELVALTGYNRWYAVGLLRGDGTSSQDRRASAAARPRQRRRLYDATVLTTLRRVWVVMDCICGKRLAPVLPEMVAVLERYGELQVDPATRQKLCAISAARTAPGRSPPGWPRSGGGLMCAGAAEPNRGRCSSIRSRCAPLLNGIKPNPGSLKSTSSPTTVAWPKATTAKPSM